MEAYDNNVEAVQDSRVYTTYTKARSWISTLLGVIVTAIGVVLVFVVASLEGTKEVKASNSDSGKILIQWREATGSTDTGFPKEKVDIVNYKDREYYFIIDEINYETKEIIKWHFAYDGGIEYVFQDFKFYILTAITIAISMYVAYINYISTVKHETSTSGFAKTLLRYQKKKETIEKHTQYVPDFCIYKNKQAHENAKREIVESADINYDYYMSNDFNPNKLEKWQKKKLKKIKKIKIKKIHSSDLLQEHGMVSTKISLLPISQTEHQQKYLLTGFIKKTISTALNGLVVAFGVVFGNWVLGATYGFTVLISYMSAVVVATDFVNTTLRNRFLAKADLLGEFDNIKDMFIKAETEDCIVEIDQPTIIQRNKDNLLTETVYN